MHIVSSLAGFYKEAGQRTMGLCGKCIR